MNIYFLDFETTGLNPFNDDLIEIAIKKIDTNEYYQTLIKPKVNGIHYKYISPKIESITHITDDMIENNSLDPDEVILKFINYIKRSSKEGPIYIIAHNGINFDFLFLKRLFKEHGDQSNKRITRNNKIDKSIIQRFKFIDSILLAKLTIKSDSYSQASLCKRFGIINNCEHRALGDINALEKLYDKLTLHLSYNDGSPNNIYKYNASEIYKRINIL